MRRFNHEPIHHQGKIKGKNVYFNACSKNRDAYTDEEAKCVFFYIGFGTRATGTEYEEEVHMWYIRQNQTSRISEPRISGNYRDLEFKHKRRTR